MCHDYYHLKSIIRRNHRVNILMVTCTLTLITCGILVATHYYLFPKSGPYFTYQIPDMYFFTWIYVICGIGFTIPALGITTLLSIVICMGIIMYFYLIPILVVELRLGLHPGSYKTLGKLRHPEHLVRNWRALEILVKIVCLNFGIFLVPLQTIFMYLSLFCNVTMIVFSEEMKTITKLVMPTISLAATVGWAVFITLAGKLFSDSKATLSSWKIERWATSEKDRKYMKKVKRACQPLSVSAGKYFILRPKSALNYLRGVSRGTFRSLIAVSKALKKS